MSIYFPKDMWSLVSIERLMTMHIRSNYRYYNISTILHVVDLFRYVGNCDHEAGSRLSLSQYGRMILHVVDLSLFVGNHDHETGSRSSLSHGGRIIQKGIRI